MSATFLRVCSLPTPARLRHLVARSRVPRPNIPERINKSASCAQTHSPHYREHIRRRAVIAYLSFRSFGGRRSDQEAASCCRPTTDSHPSQLCVLPTVVHLHL